MLTEAFLANVVVAGSAAVIAGLGLAVDALERHYTRSGADTWNTPLDDLAPIHVEEDTTAMKRRAVKADEQDVVTGWRRYLCCMQRAGVTDAIKRRMRRRERHQARRRIRREGDCW